MTRTYRHSPRIHLLLRLSLALLPFAPLLGHCGEPPEPRSPFPPEKLAMMKQYDVDERRITVRQINLFHLHFIDTCMQAMPREVMLEYIGIVATDNGRKNVREYGLAIGGPLDWYVFEKGGLVIFSLWISTQRTKQTAAKCVLEGQELFVNLGSEGEPYSDSKLNEPLATLGGHSVREVIKEIEKPLRKPGAPPP